MSCSIWWRISSSNKRPAAILLIGVCSLALVQCTNRPTAATAEHTHRVELDLGKSDQRRLIAFYFGGMVSEAGRNPFDAGWIQQEGERFFLELDSVSGRWPSLGAAMKSVANDGTIDWEEFEPLVAAHYYRFRSLPGTLDSLKQQVGEWADSTRWFSFEVNGVMSPSIRRIHVYRDALIQALESYAEADSNLVYDQGTTFISEHLDGESVREVSVMSKRADGHWDFYAYDGGGALTPLLEREPTDLDIPTKCVGCHFGNRLFEPERSFPADARPAPDGPRKLYVSATMKNANVVAALDEHRKRSDTILGLYGTLFISHVLSGEEPDSALGSLIRNLGF